MWISKTPLAAIVPAEVIVESFGEPVLFWQGPRFRRRRQRSERDRGDGEARCDGGFGEVASPSGSERAE